jgi:hypothetical protein
MSTPSSPAQIARQLQTTTGIPFEVKGAQVMFGGAVTSEQFALLRRVTDAAHLPQPVAEMPVLAMDDVSSTAGLILATLADGEPARVQRLEDGKGELERKSGIRFAFDESHRMLVGEPGQLAAETFYELTNN